MKKLLLGALVLFSVLTKAQISDPVHWSYSVEETAPGEFDLLFTAKIDKGWHLYTTKVVEDANIPTTFKFKSNKDFTAVGGIKEAGYITEDDPMFGKRISFYMNKAVFRQHIKANKKGKFKITGELEYMACKEVCLPPTPEDFSFEIDNKSDVAASTVEVSEPVTWAYSTRDLGNGTIEFKAEATIAKGYHVYSSDLGPEAAGAGPEETKFTYDPGFEASGKINEPKATEEFDPNFNLKLKFHSDKVAFTQILKKTGNSNVLQGHLKYQVCNAEMCMPGREEFAIDIATGQLTEYVEPAGATLAKVDPKVLKLANVDLNNPLNNCGEGIETSQGKSLWTIFILGFLGGLLALLTPCVFPMIPLTVSFFTKGSKNKKKGIVNASIYGGFILLIYLILSLPFHLMDSLDPEILNTISTNVWLNLGFFVVFIVFAISFFGYFEITLPSSLANKADSASEIGGLIGIFFMALTLALVSFSCTGPILGSLLAGSLTSNGGAIQLTAGMGGFGLALALPFTLFALFPGMLQSLPKSGGWLNSVKVVLGFIEVALAIKFLSTADLVGHWGILKIEAFLGIWILVGAGLALYFFGKLRFPHDSPIKKLGALRLVLGTITAAFVIYLATGFRYNEKNQGFESLTVLSGLAPSSGYSWIYPSPCPLNLSCFHNYEDGMEYAQKVGKPVFLDFTGHGCVNCRKMEENVWPDEEVFKMLNEKYVVISLYVDDREQLPADQQFEYITANGKKKKIRTVGDKWATLETETFNINSQPFYALLSTDGKLLNKPVSYTPDADKYQAFLECGLETFKNYKRAK